MWLQDHLSGTGSWRALWVELGAGHPWLTNAIADQIIPREDTMTVAALAKDRGCLPTRRSR